jgi:hypothetical protein
METSASWSRVLAWIRGPDGARLPIVEGQVNMAQIKSSAPLGSCKPPLRSLSKSSLVFIGTDSHGNWVVRDQTGLFGGRFVNRSEALRFAMLENGDRPRGVVLVPEGLEFSINGAPKVVANDARALARPSRNRKVGANLKLSSRVRL